MMKKSTSRRSLVQRLSTGALSLVCSGTLAFAQPQSCVVPTNNPQPLDAASKKTVVITDATDPAVFQTGDFSLSRTLGNILKTSGAMDTTAEKIALLSSLIRSFRVATHVNPDSQVTMPMTLRPNEAALDPLILLSNGAGNMRPVGLFNRFDLAPADFATCGEARIVYAKDQVLPAGRFFLIFEAALDNPNPKLGAEGCRPIAQFWDSLKGKSGNELTTLLEKFYYEGKVAPGVTEPVVHFTNYGFPLGQIRGNLFVQSTPPAPPTPPIWQLREWRITLSADGTPVFTPDTVKTNPFPPLYRAQAAGEDPKISDLRKLFQPDLVDSRVPELVAVDQGGIVNQEQSMDLFFQLGTRFHKKFDGFESTSHDDRDNPQAIAVLDLKTKIGQRLNQIGVGSACQLTQEHVLNRTGALSCGGCHQFTAGKTVAAGVTWPPSAQGGFVHITETGLLSPALELFFLPARQRNLVRHLQPAPPPPAPVAAPTDHPRYPRFVALREKAASVARSDNRLSAVGLLSEIEKSIQSERTEEQAIPGAFISIRRPH